MVEVVCERECYELSGCALVYTDMCCCENGHVWLTEKKVRERGGVGGEGDE